jgi:hypothetical protein
MPGRRMRLRSHTRARDHRPGALPPSHHETRRHEDATGEPQQEPTGENAAEVRYPAPHASHPRRYADRRIRTVRETAGMGTAPVRRMPASRRCKAQAPGASEPGSRPERSSRWRRPATGCTPAARQLRWRPIPTLGVEGCGFGLGTGRGGRRSGRRPSLASCRPPPFAVQRRPWSPPRPRLYQNCTQRGWPET